MKTVIDIENNLELMQLNQNFKLLDRSQDFFSEVADRYVRPLKSLPSIPNSYYSSIKSICVNIQTAFDNEGARQDLKIISNLVLKSVTESTAGFFKEFISKLDIVGICGIYQEMDMFAQEVSEISGVAFEFDISIFIPYRDRYSYLESAYLKAKSRGNSYKLDSMEAIKDAKSCVLRSTAFIGRIDPGIECIDDFLSELVPTVVSAKARVEQTFEMYGKVKLFERAVTEICETSLLDSIDDCMFLMLPGTHEKITSYILKLRLAILDQLIAPIAHLISLISSAESPLLVVTELQVPLPYIISIGEHLLLVPNVLDENIPIELQYSDIKSKLPFLTDTDYMGTTEVTHLWITCVARYLKTLLVKEYRLVTSVAARAQIVCDLNYFFGIIQMFFDEEYDAEILLK